MSEKDTYIVEIQEHILEGIQKLEVHAGCAEEAEQRAIDLLSEWIGKEDLTVLTCKRIKINETEKC